MTPQALAAYRHSKGLSAKKMGELIGVSRSSIINYESGLSIIPLTVELAISAVEAGLSPYIMTPTDAQAIIDNHNKGA